ncbi:Transposon TX1 uncharacterized 149 kDa protein [Vitis vinifera]|uniref:Transposon TX1 uncharacterized 149 kDa protein n=1 Tax=Vitis vinifera TaxID=29760 RepID=A0A438CX95_VITVI|nr:Transposon TX1 uncharacterized 149 kDa protein [Vitis vinifera]
MWLRVEGFMDKVKDWWQSYSFRGKPSFVLAKKLQALKYDLKRWNKEAVGNVTARKDAALEELNSWDRLESCGPLSEEDRHSQRIVRDEFSHCAILEEISWRQKSRALWLKEGDSNTKFFHRMANARRRGNFISSLTVRGVRLSKEEELREGIGSYFKSLFEEPRVRRPDVESSLFKTLDALDNETLEGHFSEEEVYKAISELGGDKAPGPDGFTLAFWKSCWPIVGGEVMQVFEEFHVQNNVFRSHNATFLVLIPKKGGASDVQDFRPISLLGSLYKIIAKVLTNRLKRVMGKLVSYSQNAFVEGRQILDAVLVANEAIDSRKRSASAGLVCKLDIEKAYDHVNWKFLLSVLEKMGFGPKWRSWILFCISTVRMAVLVNGTPTEFFSTYRGLRQGDPLSPYLFVLIMEAFSSLISKAEEKGFIRGLKINLKKSEIIPVGGVEDVDRAAAVFGCKVGNLPTTYLGLPLGALHNSCRVWDGVEERFKRKLATWKKLYLSKGGRLTLIKSTLSNLPIYFMSLFVIPRKVRIRLEKIQREFLWGDVEGRRRIHLVRWTAICKDKKYGGLGLRHLKEFNHALLGKWLWRFSLERESLWRKVIVGKFGEGEGGWTTREVRESYGMSLWKDIRKGWRSSSSEPVLVLEMVDVPDFALVADLWGRQGDGGGDGRCTLEDLFMIGIGGDAFFVKENEESTDHILIHCGKTRELWTVVLSSFGVVWVFPNSVRNLLLEWKIKGLEKKRSVVWKMVPICLFWCIWGERNRRMFQEEEKSDMSLKNLFLRLFLNGFCSFPLLPWVSAFLEIHDIAGLVRGAHQGQGLGNSFLSHIRAVDGIFHVLRAFEDPDIIHVDDSVDPVRI